MSKYVISLDVGERRIGVAIASMIARLPSPLTTIDRLKTPDAFSEIETLCRQNEVGRVVVGLPRGMGGQETAQTGLARQFAAELSRRLDMPVTMQDEAGTSIEAERLLRARNRPYTKGDIDAEAAVLILRDHLQQAAESTA
jgi:putative Holliday junction resolvase